MEDEYGRSAAGPALRAADTEEEPNVRDDHRADARTRHRRESRDLCRRECRAVAAAALPRTRAYRPRVRPHQRALSRKHGLVGRRQSGADRVARYEPELLRTPRSNTGTRPDLHAVR